MEMNIHDIKFINVLIKDCMSSEGSIYKWGAKLSSKLKFTRLVDCCYESQKEKPNENEVKVFQNLYLPQQTAKNYL